jgi:hypothetical protein
MSARGDEVTAELHASLERVEALLERGALAECEAYARQTAEQAGMAGDRAIEAYACSLEGVALVYLGVLSEGLAALEAGLALALEQHDPALERNVLLYHVDGYLALGRWGDAEERLARARELSELLGEAEQPHRAQLLAIRLLLEQAMAADADDLPAPDAGEVEQRLQVLVDAARAQESSALLAHALRWQGAWWLHRRAHEAAEQAIAEGARLADQQEMALLGAEHRWLHARLLAATGRTEQATLAYENARARAAAIGYRWLETLCLPGLVELGSRGRGRRQALERLRTLGAGLIGDDLTAFLNRADHRAVLRAGLAAPPENLHGSPELLDALTTLGETSDLAGVLEQALAALISYAGAQRAVLVLVDDAGQVTRTLQGLDEGEADALLDE